MKKPGEIFADSFCDSFGKSLGNLMFWLPVIYFGRDIWIHIIDAISSHIH